MHTIYTIRGEEIKLDTKHTRQRSTKIKEEATNKKGLRHTPAHTNLTLRETPGEARKLVL